MTVDVANLSFGSPTYARLVIQWSKRDIEVRYRRSAIHVAWSLIQPLLQVALYAFVFGTILNQTGGELPYLSYVLAGMLIFRIVIAALGVNRCFTDYRDLLGHLAFPREILPLTQVLAALVEVVVLLPALFVVAWVQGIEVTPMVLLVPVVLLGVVLLSLGVGILVSTVQVFVGDVAFVITFLGQMLFFASPISYQPEQLPSRLAWVNNVNPISVYTEAMRDVVLRGVAPNWVLLGAQMILAGVLLVGAIAHLRAVGHRMVDVG